MTDPHVRYKDVFQEERKKGLVTRCPVCGREFRKDWLREEGTQTYCGPCYFGGKK